MALLFKMIISRFSGTLPGSNHCGFGISGFGISHRYFGGSYGGANSNLNAQIAFKEFVEDIGIKSGWTWLKREKNILKDVAKVTRKIEGSKGPDGIKRSNPSERWAVLDLECLLRLVSDLKKKHALTNKERRRCGGGRGGGAGGGRGGRGGGGGGGIGGGGIGGN